MPHVWPAGGLHMRVAKVNLKGGVEQMPGHGTFVRYQDSQVFINYHTDAFECIPEEEV